MSDETKQVLEMLKSGKVSVDEAEKLIAALGAEETEGAPEKPKGLPKYLRVVVDGGEQKVNIRVPMKLIRAGMKFSALIPEQARAHIEKHLGEKGIDFDLRRLKPEDLEEFIAGLEDFTVDVDDGGEKKVRIFCE